MKIAAVASMNIPTTIRNAYSTNRMIIRLSEIPAIRLATLLGSPSSSNNREAGFAAIATKRIVPVDLAFLQMILGRSVHFRFVNVDRYQNGIHYCDCSTLGRCIETSVNTTQQNNRS